MQAKGAALILSDIFGFEVTLDQAKALKGVVARDISKPSWEDVISIARADTQEKSADEIRAMIGTKGSGIEGRHNLSGVAGIRNPGPGGRVNAESAMRSVENIVIRRENEG